MPKQLPRASPGTRHVSSTQYAGMHAGTQSTLTPSSVFWSEPHGANISFLVDSPLSMAEQRTFALQRDSRGLFFLTPLVGMSIIDAVAEIREKYVHRKQ